MIVLDLQCANHHRFEAWFASREAFEQQAGQGLVQCAFCRSTQIVAMPSGPRVLRSHEGDDVPPRKPELEPAQDEVRKIYQALAEVARKAENVGERFPEEARRIHYDEAPARSIRGQATQEETRELLEEGIFVLPAPVPPENDTH